MHLFTACTLALPEAGKDRACAVGNSTIHLVDKSHQLRNSCPDSRWRMAGGGWPSVDEVTNCRAAARRILTNANNVMQSRWRVIDIVRSVCLIHHSLPSFLRDSFSRGRLIGRRSWRFVLRPVTNRSWSFVRREDLDDRGSFKVLTVLRDRTAGADRFGLSKSGGTEAPLF